MAAPKILSKDIEKYLHWIVALGFVVAIFLFIAFMTESPSYQKCYGEYYEQYKTQTDQQGLGSPYIWGKITCGAIFIDDHTGSVTVLETLLIAYFTFLLWWSTHRLWRSTEKLWETSEEQSRDIKNSIKEAARSAGAMESIAESMKANVARMKDMADQQRTFWKMQMKAYISTSLEGYAPQNTLTGFHYQISLFVKNTGHTPAHNIKFAIRTVVRPHPLPEDTDFSLPLIDTGGYIAPGQQSSITAVLDDVLEDRDIHEIKFSLDRKWYVFGSVSYEDVFGDSHYSNFCQWVAWFEGNHIRLINTPRHNDAT